MHNHFKPQARNSQDMNQSLKFLTRGVAKSYNLILSLLGAVLKSNAAHPSAIGFQPSSSASVPQYSSLKSFGPFVVSFNFIGSDALQALVITPALSPPSQIPSSFETQQSNQMHHTRRPGAKFFVGWLAYKLLINPAWSMYFLLESEPRPVDAQLDGRETESLWHAVPYVEPGRTGQG
jgi:hypothetical protein